MAKNIEIKARLKDLSSGLETAKTLSGKDPEIIHQEDFFFNCANGRLKLRMFSSSNGELIFYNRKNKKGPKTSEYFISKTVDPMGLKNVLYRSHGICGVVKKTRYLFLVGRIRIHIDQVENLGSYLEFEVVLSENENDEDGKKEAYRLMEQFGVKEEDLIDSAYVDLINGRNENRKVSIEHTI